MEFWRIKKDWIRKPAFVPKPEHAEFPYWAFTDTYNVDTSAGGTILTLDVPMNEAVFFQSTKYRICL